MVPRGAFDKREREGGLVEPEPVMITVVQHVKQVSMERVRVAKALEIIKNQRELVLHELLDELDFGQIKVEDAANAKPLEISTAPLAVPDTIVLVYSGVRASYREGPNVNVATSPSLPALVIGMDGGWFWIR
eukprot:IDg4046t1